MLADRLSEQIRRCPNISQPALFVVQIENLKKADDIQRNMSILAIEPIPSTLSRVEMVRHELLVTRMLLYDKGKGFQLDPLHPVATLAVAVAGKNIDFCSSTAEADPAQRLDGVIASAVVLDQLFIPYDVHGIEKLLQCLAPRGLRSDLGAPR